MLNKIKQKSYDEGYNIGKASGYSSGLEKGKEIGYKAGEIIGYKKGHDEGYNKALAWATEYYKGTNHDQYIKQEVDKVEIKQTSKNENRITEDFIIWLTPIVEIMDTKYFKTTFFDYMESKGIKEFIDYIDFLEHTNAIKLQYPKTYYYLPQLKKSFTNAYKNKLIVEEAEKILK